MKARARQGRDSLRGRDPARLWSVMYPAHFRMTENPFAADTDPKFLWLGGRRREILSDLVRGILDGARVHVVLGAHGTGKTLLAQAVVDELGDRVLAAVVPFAEYKGIDFLKLVERAFGIGADPGGRESFTDRFSEFLRRTGASGRPAVLIVDDAHRMNGAGLRELSRISGLSENGAPLLQLVFFGENRFRDLLNDEANRGLFESAGVRLSLDALTRDETAQYIRHRLRVTQCERELFTSDAVEEIFTYSKGIPGLINRACEAALSRAFYLGEQLVPQDTVREALKLMPAEKAAIAAPAGNLSFEMAAAGGPEKKDEEADDEDEPGIPAGQVRRHNRSWVAYAVLGGLLIVLIAVVSIVLKGRSPAPPPAAEMKKPVASPPADKATTPAVAGQIPGPPVGKTQPALSSGEEPGRTAEVRGERRTARQAAAKPAAERVRRASAKGPSRSAAGAPSPAEERGSAPAADRAGAAVQEPPGQPPQQVESGEVIDWLLKRRAGQK
ncbi:MAG: AAA family ATPase [Syntrophaceae bacterium]|nr:AAA family ATPase [Syntrophaceae bacterium]